MGFMSPVSMFSDSYAWMSILFHLPRGRDRRLRVIKNVYFAFSALGRVDEEEYGSGGGFGPEMPETGKAKRPLASMRLVICTVVPISFHWPKKRPFQSILGRKTDSVDSEGLHSF